MRSLAPPAPHYYFPFYPSTPLDIGFCGRRLSLTGAPAARLPLTPLAGNPLRAALPIRNHYSDDEDEDEDDDVAADEYDVGLTADVSEEEEEEEEEGESEAEPLPAAGPSPQSAELKSQRVERLIAEASEFGEEVINYEELAGVYDFPVDKFQRLAIQAFLRGSSVIVSAPTSSGKTLIAEAAAVATVARGSRLFYTTPLKALSNQKFRDFRKAFGESNVGLLTGDSSVNKDAKILIMTTEILRNMLYQSVGMMSSGSRLFHVDVIILDEVHYLSDLSRGTVWEEIIIYCPKEVQLICLSATVANPDELAGWIGKIHGKTELVTSNKRPVPLIWHFSLKNALLPLLDKKGTSMNRKLSIDYTSSRAELYSEKKPRKNRWGKMERGLNHTTSISRQTLSKNDISSIRRMQSNVCGEFM